MYTIYLYHGARLNTAVYCTTTGLRSRNVTYEELHKYYNNRTNASNNKKKKNKKITC